MLPNLDAEAPLECPPGRWPFSQSPGRATARPTLTVGLSLVVRTSSEVAVVPSLCNPWQSGGRTARTHSTTGRLRYRHNLGRDVNASPTVLAVVDNRGCVLAAE
jgi:hypothetical protein